MSRSSRSSGHRLQVRSPAFTSLVASLVTGPRQAHVRGARPAKRVRVMSQPPPEVVARSVGCVRRLYRATTVWQCAVRLLRLQVAGQQVQSSRCLLESSQVRFADQRDLTCQVAGRAKPVYCSSSEPQRFRGSAVQFCSSAVLLQFCS